MAYNYLLKRLLSLLAGILAVSTLGPILGFNVYFNQLKEEYRLNGISGEHTIFHIKTSEFKSLF